MLFSYIIWHYSLGLVYITKKSLRLMRAIFNLFSIRHLLQTLFYPWHRRTEMYESGFNVSGFLWTFSGNMIARVLGAIVRAITIIAGLMMEILALIFSIIRLLLWIIMPPAVPVAFYYALTLFL